MGAYGEAGIKQGISLLGPPPMPAWVSSTRHRAVVAALIEQRKIARLTQRDLAARLGKPPSFVGKVESIERNLSMLEFLEWCDVLGVEAAVVLSDAGTQQASL